MLAVADATSYEARYVAWRGGSREAGDALIREHGPSVLRFLSNKVGAAAEDLLQETFMACMKVSTDPAEVRSFRALLFGVARKQVLRHYEGRGQLKGEEMMSRISLAELATTPTQRIAKHEEQDLLQRAMATIPLDFQIALELRYWQRLSAVEVAAAVGLTENGARTRFRRARLKLKEAYATLSGGAQPPEWPEE